ncbi:MAG: hypothetical protein IKQ89_00025 [Muribaculaceae bacterium]|nr:hypothetical protein [Muribaculaceae bacterium]
MEEYNNFNNEELNPEMNEKKDNTGARVAAIGGAVLASAAGGAGIAYAATHWPDGDQEEAAEEVLDEVANEGHEVKDVKVIVKVKEDPEPPKDDEPVDFISINNLKVVDMGHTEINGQEVAYCVVQEPVTEDYYYMYDVDNDQVFDVIANQDGEYAFFDQTNPLETISYADAFEHVDDQELMARMIAEGETPAQWEANQMMMADADPVDFATDISIDDNDDTADVDMVSTQDDDDDVVIASEPQPLDDDGYMAEEPLPQEVDVDPMADTIAEDVYEPDPTTDDMMADISPIDDPVIDDIAPIDDTIA